MIDFIEIAFLTAVAIALVLLFSRLLRNMASKLLLFILNGMGGLILLLILVYVFGVGIPVKLATIAVVLIFGLPGLGCLLILHYGDII